MLSGSGGIGGGSSVQWSKPAALVCHICGREYGTTSLKIHIPQCEKMWIEREKLKPKNERRPVPKAAANVPLGAKLDMRNPDAMAAYNEAATKQFNERALVPCQNCGRTFFEDRLAIHLRSCRPGNEAARVGTGRIKSASEATAAATPLKVPVRSVGGAGGLGSPTSSLSPPSAGGPKRLSPSSASGSKPRGAGAGAGVSFADGGGNGGASQPSSSRPRVAPVKQSGGTWEDDLNDELEAGEIIPPKKSYAIPAGAGPADDGEGGELAECSLCGRHFNVDRLAKHESICQKQQASEAKRQKRIAAKQSQLPQPGTQKSANTDAWKSKHNEFQSAIQYAKKLTAMQKAGVSLANLPPPPRSENPDYVECPHCSRRFNQQAAERHIPACANTINKPKPVPRNGPVKPPAAGSMAAQRAAQASRSPPAQGRDPYAQQFGGEAARPGSSVGSMPRSSAASSGSRAPAARAAPSSVAARPAGATTRPAAQRSPSSAYAGGQEDLHSKINQLTETVQQLSKVVLKSPQGGGGGGKSCRSCGELNPVATAKFCPHCGSRS